MNCAPIVVFTYARPEHTRKMLDALAGNIGSGESRLFIFCDGPKNEKTVEKNREVRRIIEDEKTKNRFLSVTAFLSEKNNGLAKSVISGVDKIIHEYGSCIVVEDDLITSKYFLQYMNECLAFFKNDKTIWSISGFTYALRSLKNYPHDVYLSYRACSHGWATWVDRWELTDWEVRDFKALSRSVVKRHNFKRGGNDLYRMLRHQMRGERDSWAIRFCYSQSKNGMYCIYPKHTLVKNIGFDGSGTHCSNATTKRNIGELYEEAPLRIEAVEKDAKILREFKKQYRVTFKSAVKWVLAKAREKLASRFGNLPVKSR